MTLHTETITIDDLVRELNPDALKYFAEMELSDEWPTYDSPLRGKFVRLGEVILLGTTIGYGPLNHRGRRSLITHSDMLTHSFLDMDENMQERIRATAPEEGEYLHDVWPIVDAGYSQISTEHAQPVGLILDNESHNFGRPTEAIRQRTGEIAQRLVGAGVVVFAE